MSAVKASNLPLLGETPSCARSISIRSPRRLRQRPAPRCPMSTPSCRAKRRLPAPRIPALSFHALLRASRLRFRDAFKRTHRISKVTPSSRSASAWTPRATSPPPRFSPALSPRPGSASACRAWRAPRSSGPNPRPDPSPSRSTRAQRPASRSARRCSRSLGRCCELLGAGRSRRDFDGNVAVL